MKNNKVYDTAVEAKKNVEILINRVDPAMSVWSLVDYIHELFTPNEKMVVAAGYFLLDEKFDKRFIMPSTVKLIEFMEKQNYDKYEKGFVRITVKQNTSLPNNHKALSQNMYLWVPSEYDYDKKSNVHAAMSSPNYI